MGTIDDALGDLPIDEKEVEKLKEKGKGLERFVGKYVRLVTVGSSSSPTDSASTIPYSMFGKLKEVDKQYIILEDVVTNRSAEKNVVWYPSQPSNIKVLLENETYIFIDKIIAFNGVKEFV
ncbi:MAG TPA: hypothetical protein VJJ23_00640 [Candidatus Nanoarchaeia archaeon]|nr:hypothetical protein [Candidatus Nanoarchaeia archaeon]